MCLSVGSCLPWDFTTLYLSSEAGVWALVVAGALLAKTGLQCVSGGCCHGVQEPISDCTKHLCCSALTVSPKEGSVVLPAHITQHPEQQSRLEGSACAALQANKAALLSRAALTSSSCEGHWNSFWQHKMLWETIAKDAAGLARPSD